LTPLGFAAATGVALTASECGLEDNPAGAIPAISYSGRENSLQQQTPVPGRF